MLCAYPITIVKRIQLILDFEHHRMKFRCHCFLMEEDFIAHDKIFKK